MTITREILNLIRVYAKEKCEALRIKLIILNGYQDHIHILLSIPPKYSLSQIIKEIKGYTSFMISGVDFPEGRNANPPLKWQRGYVVFTVDKNSFEGIFEYIKNQERNHAFKEKMEKTSL